jgi:ribonuclease P/MRP protein subunit POP1
MSLIKEEVIESQSVSPDEETRTVWIRCHPAIFSTVLSTLKGAVSLTLDTLKKSPGHSEKSHSVEILDLRESINVFEITGPKSSQVVHGALTPAITNHNGEFKKVRYLELSQLLTASSFMPSFGRLWLASRVRVLSQATWSLALPF